jgi:hypothetical protein
MEVHMQTTQGTVLEMMRGVQGFLDTNAAALGGVVRSGSRHQLDDLVLQLSGHASTQSSSSQTAKAATAQAKALRTALMRDHLQPIAAIAAVDLPANPALQAAFKLPKGRPTPEKLVAFARGVAENAAKYADVFIAALMPDDFIAQLNAAADALLATVTDRKQSSQKRGTATSGLKRQVSDANRVLSVIDKAVKSALKDNPALLDGWNQIKKVRKTAGRPQTPPPPVPIPTLASATQAVSSTPPASAPAPSPSEAAK